MNSAIRWRIIILQVIAVLVLGVGSFGTFYANNFTNQQIHDELAPQQITFPADAQSGLLPGLEQYASQQVLNGDQAHAYAEKFIAVHLNSIGQGKPYSYWSGQAIQATDPAMKAKDQGIADTLFKGETLRSLLDFAWTFSIFGLIALYAGIALAIAASAVLLALIFEVVGLFKNPVSVTASQKTVTQAVA